MAPADSWHGDALDRQARRRRRCRTGSVCPGLFSLDRLREPAQFEPWVYRIATNAAMDYLRRHRRVRVRVSDLSDEQLSTLERAVAMRDAADHEQQQELQDLAAHLLALVSPEDRTLLTLKEIEGLSVRELGAIFSIKEEAVKVRLFRGGNG